MRESQATNPSGFTLIELLVVIAIIAILAALLFPLYGRAKDAGHTAKCLSHEKELYGAVLMYVQDYNDWLPNDTFLHWTETPQGRRGQFIPYVKNTEILVCQKTGSYGYNISLKGPVDYGSWAWVGGSIASRVRVHKEKGHAAYPRPGRPFNDVKIPSRMMVFICGQPTQGVNPAGNEGNGWEWEPHDIGDEYSARMDHRHGTGTTYAFLDGHARCLRPTGTKYNFPVATDGLDYDGDGILGSVDFMR